MAVVPALGHETTPQVCLVRLLVHRPPSPPLWNLLLISPLWVAAGMVLPLVPQVLDRDARSFFQKCFTDLSLACSPTLCPLQGLECLLP